MLAFVGVGRHVHSPGASGVPAGSLVVQAPAASVGVLARVGRRRGLPPLRASAWRVAMLDLACVAFGGVGDVAPGSAYDVALGVGSCRLSWDHRRAVAQGSVRVGRGGARFGVVGGARPASGVAYGCHPRDPTLAVLGVRSMAW